MDILLLNVNIKKQYSSIQLDLNNRTIKLISGVKTNKTKDLGVRVWEWIHDKDINVSVNILFEGLKNCFGN